MEKRGHSLFIHETIDPCQSRKILTLTLKKWKNEGRRHALFWAADGRHSLFVAFRVTIFLL